MTIDSDASPEATLGYFVPEQEFIKLQSLCDQLILLAAFAASRQNKVDDVLVPVAALAQCFFDGVKVLQDTIASATWKGTE